ncbi:GDSL-type esterase/lipase family protein [Thetidibacter halocola]|uniref:GDSL family lipase n=1 Tax=Thetidibacter halocola TaxID=2827239 RepID=A0A8J7WA52_9RHOB|nr:GDSL-type esterase/lipase family protein [Thetidibacter halocola]MBS0122744.1 GDSL family lipase [Thetidibacter halocola]
MATILCYGDSNTHGTRPMSVAGLSERHPPGVPWPDVMAAALGPAHRVIAEGLPGRTTVHEDLVEGGARNGLAVLPAILHSHKPLDLMVLMLGTNDLKPRFSVTAHEIARSVLRLALLARAEAVVQDVLIVSPAPVREAGCLAEVFVGAEARQAGLAGVLRDLAEASGFGFADAGAHVTVSDFDGVHWDAPAHAALGAAMARIVADRLG